MANRKKGKLRNCLWPFYREGIVNFLQFRPEAYTVWVESTLEMAGCEKLAFAMAFVRKPLLHLWRLIEVCYKLPWCIIYFLFLLSTYVSIKKYFLNCLSIIGLYLLDLYKIFTPLSNKYIFIIKIKKSLKINLNDYINQEF